MKKNVLWVSAAAPYDKVAHAGGQIHNYYLKELIKNEDIDVSLVTFCEYKDIDVVNKDLDFYGIKHELIYWTRDICLSNIYRKVLYEESQKNPFSKYCGLTNDYNRKRLLSILNKIKNEPDIIILQWTQVILFIEDIKELFPNSKVIAIEEDVTYLSYYRKWKKSKDAVTVFVNGKRYKRFKEIEIGCLKKSDLVILNNPKDEKLVNNEGINNTWHWTPFFQDMTHSQRAEKPKGNIVFYGAMGRDENHDSAMWFINNVFNRIKNDNMKFLVIGNKPRQELIGMANDRVIVTGFVDSVEPYFKDALCCVAPLVMGAGVKIKVLEALSAGVPVLTNDIGIEGIPAHNNIDYFYCNSPEEYIDVINKLYSSTELAVDVGNAAKAFIAKNYDFKKDAITFANIIRKL